MTQDQIIILAVLAATVAMFVWARWRHDMVALAALLACVLAELVPAEQAFAGFGHPAVITVACVLVLSRSLQTSGAVDAFTRRMLPKSTGPMLTIAALAAVAAVLSAFMNNVGALALLMPVALQIAARHELPPGKVLMPLAFGSILGGMTTLIGTPTNLIVSGFRAQTGVGSFTMFDFTPVGIAIAGVGIVFLALLGPRLVPTRERAGTEGFETGSYLTEARIPENSKTAGKTMREIETILDDVDAQVVGLIRHEVRMLALYPTQAVRAGDILIIVADPEGLTTALTNLDLKLEEAVHAAPPPAEDLKPDNSGETATPAAEADSEKPKSIEAGEIVLMEFAVLPDSNLNGRSATDTHLRTQFGVNLLAVSRQGRRSITRLRTMELHAGDVLLMQGAPEALSEFAAQYGCVPLAERELRIPDKRRALTATGIMLVAVSGAAFGLVPAAIAFAAGVLASMALRLVPPRTVYDAIDWPVIVLLGAMISVAGAIASSGAADLIARLLLTHVAQGHAIVGLALILVVTMTLSDFMNNAATAAVMCPIAISTAERLGASADPFLMAVAIGASCAFLTPIGHQNNTLILGPGGFQFGDYWRLGLPLELLVLAVSIPMLLWVWPL